MKNMVSLTPSKEIVEEMSIYERNRARCPSIIKNIINKLSVIKSIKLKYIVRIPDIVIFTKLKNIAHRII